MKWLGIGIDRSHFLFLFLFLFPGLRDAAEAEFVYVLCGRRGLSWELFRLGEQLLFSTPSGVMSIFTPNSHQSVRVYLYIPYNFIHNPHHLVMWSSSFSIGVKTFVCLQLTLSMHPYDLLVANSRDKFT